MTSVLLVALVLLVPGAGAALAIAPPAAITIESRIALAFGLGYAIVAGVSISFALAHALSSTAFVIGIVASSVAVWLLAFRRATPGEHARALIAQTREAPLSVAAGVALLTAVAVSRLFYPPRLNLSIAAPWRYWADGLEIAAAQRVQPETKQWGTEIPTTVSKVVFNTFQAGVSHLLGPEPLPAMHGVLSVTAVGLVAVLLALGREFGLGFAAPLVPGIAVLLPPGLPLSHGLAIDLATYKAENIGRLVAFCAVLTGVFLIRRPDRLVLAVVTGVLLATASLTHLIPAVVAGAVLGSYLLACLVLGRNRLRTLGASGALTLAIFAAAYIGVLGLAGGDVGFQTATRSSGFVGLPSTIDPTSSFANQRFVRRSPDSRFKIPPREIADSFATRAGRIPQWPQYGWALLLLLSAGSVGMVVANRDLLPVAVVSWGLGAALLAAALFFSFRYSTVIPANFGQRRLFSYVALLPALLIPGLLAAFAGPLVRKSRRAAPVLALLAGGLAIGGAIERVPTVSQAPAAVGLHVIERVSAYVPCTTRMLVNARTAGTWEATTGRRGLIEGMAPYLRPEIMAHVLPLLIEARAFFRRPVAKRELLVREDVDYVVYVKPGAWIGTAEGRIPGDGDLVALSSLPELRLVLRDRHVSIFAMRNADTAQPAGHPKRCSL